MSGWWTALRIARREARRHRGRSVLVVVMIGIPVAALTLAAAIFDMTTLTPAESYQRLAGNADALVRIAGDGPIQQNPTSEDYTTAAPADAGTPTPTGADQERTLRSLLPAGSRTILYQDFEVPAHTSGGIGVLNAKAVDLSDPLTGGLATLSAGRAPHGAGEVALSAAAAERTGARLGGVLRLTSGSPYRVVGIVAFGTDGEVAVFDPAGRPPSDAAGTEAGRWLVHTPGPLDWPAVQQLNRHGIVALSRAVVQHPPATSAYAQATRGQAGTSGKPLAMGVLVAGAAALEIVLLVGPAFMVSARRRSRDMGLLAATGATPAQLRRVVLADGLVLGLAGAAGGILVGMAAAFVARVPVAVYLTHSRPGGYRVYPWALAAIAGFAVGTGLLAAAVPAFVTARQNVVAALAGRRGITRSRKRWITLGLACAGGGGGLLLLGTAKGSSEIILAGLVVAEGGLVLCTPAIVGLVARLGRMLPLTPRIALRDTARNRGSAAPAISAVMAAVAGSVALGMYAGAAQDKLQRDYVPQLPVGYASVSLGSAHSSAPTTSPARIATALRAGLPGHDTVTLNAPVCAGTANGAECDLRLHMPPAHGCPWATVTRPLTHAEKQSVNRDPRCAGGPSARQNSSAMYTADDAAHLGAVYGADAPGLAAAARVLQAGGVVVDDPAYVVDGKVTVDAFRLVDRADEPPYAAFTVPAYVIRSAVPVPAVVPSGLVRQAGLAEAASKLVAVGARVPTQAEQDHLTYLLAALEPGLSATVETGLGEDSEKKSALVVLIITAAVITVGAAAAATALAAAEGRADLTTLAAVGASPGVRRRLSVSQTAVIAGLGALLGAGVGLLLATATLAALNRAQADDLPGASTYHLIVPWTDLGIELLIVPAVAIAGAGLLTRARLPVERRV